MRRFFLLFAASLFLPVAAASASSESVFRKIDAELKVGELSREEALINKTLAVFDSEKLPQRFRGLETVTPVKHSTIIIRDLKRDVENISVEAREKLRPYLFREKRRVAGKVIDATLIPARKIVLDSHTLPNYRETQNFNIEWGNDLISPDNDVNLYPDVIDRWAEYLEASWAETIDVMGYTSPKGSGTYLVDVYIANTGNGSPSLSYGWYGYTSTYSSPSEVPFMVFNNNYSWAPPNDDPEGDEVGAMKVAAAHEFFHTSHFAIDYWEDAWWMEASATWMEDAVYDGVNDYYNYLNSWLFYPNASLLLFNGSHEYGGVIWGKYLSEHWGGNGAIKAVWDNCAIVQGASSVSAMESFFNSYSATLSEAFKEFTVKNTFMDYEEGSQYGSMDIRAFHNSYPLFIDSPSLFGKSPDYLGSNYIKLNPAAGLDMTIAFDGDEFFNGRALQWGAVVAVPTLAGYTSFDIDLDYASQSGYVTIEGYADYSSIYLIPSVLTKTGITPDESSSTSYSAYPDGVPYAYEVCLDCSIPLLPLMDFNYNDDFITGGGVVSDGGSDGGFCFIATAAYGYYDDPKVMILRRFRDRYLMTNSLGRSFVGFYYRFSPVISQLITESGWLKGIVRVLLLPAIGLSWVALDLLRLIWFFAFITFLFMIYRLLHRNQRC